jgi:hypothetical protein
MSNEEQPRDHVPEDDGVAREDPNDLEQNVRSRSTWLRLIFMLVFFALYAISRFVVFAVVILQFLWVLFTAETNDKLVKLGQSLATYTYEIVTYLTFNTNTRPFPFDRDWPDSAPGTE